MRSGSDFSWAIVIASAFYLFVLIYPIYDSGVCINRGENAETVGVCVRQWLQSVGSIMPGLMAIAVAFYWSRRQYAASMYESRKKSLINIGIELNAVRNVEAICLEIASIEAPEPVQSGYMFRPTSRLAPYSNYERIIGKIFLEIDEIFKSIDVIKNEISVTIEFKRRREFMSLLTEIRSTIGKMRRSEKMYDMINKEPIKVHRYIYEEEKIIIIKEISEKILLIRSEYEDFLEAMEQDLRRKLKNDIA